MPGPVTLPVSIPGLDNLFKDLGTQWRQNRHPIYNAAGEQVGSYDTLDAACQGQWFLFKGKAQPPPSQLYVVDFWGRKIPLSTHCTRSAQANAKGGSIIYPQAVQPASAAKAQQQAAGQAEPLPALELDPAMFSDPVATTKIGTLAIYGALAVAGIVLLTGRR